MRLRASENTDLLLGPDDPTPGFDAPAALAAAEELAALPGDLLKERLRGGLVVDLDDTLNSNHCLFLRSRAALCEVFLELAPERDPYEMAFYHREVSNALVPKYGFTPKRWYEGSLDAASGVAGRALSEAERERILAAAEIGVGVGELYPGVERALWALKRARVPMVLLTKGAEDKQREKIAVHRLERFFDDVVVTPKKDAALLREVVARYRLLDPVVVGDSESSDIKPATEAGFRSVLVDRGAPKWVVERHDGDLASLRAASFPEAVLGLVTGQSGEPEPRRA